MERTLVNKDIKYIDNGRVFKNRTALTISKVLDFLGKDYELNVELKLKNNDSVVVDFRFDGNKYIQIIDSELDIENFNLLKKDQPTNEIIGIGKSKYYGKSNEVDSIFFYDHPHQTIGSIFIEDPSLSFDYAHILPLVQKCSILHGHTSTIMVEIMGNMLNGLVIDFSEAKKIIKDAINVLDHKFFIHKKYIVKEDELHYFVEFDGPQGFFYLQLPKSTTYMLQDEATVENLAKELLQLIVPKMPKNINTIGVYIYEGVNKGAHILSNIN